MKCHLYAAAMAGFLASPVLCAGAASPAPPLGPPAQLTLPPNTPQPDELPPAEPPIECDLRASPDYIPGIDAKGRAVAPADLPSGQDIEIATEVYVETRSKDRQRRRTGVIVNLPNLGAPACVPLTEDSRK